MKTKYALPFLVAGSVALTGCFDGSDGVSPNTQVRVIHGVSDAPAVNVNINEEVTVPGADFKQAAIINPVQGTYAVSVDGILPDGSTTRVIPAANLMFEAGVDYDIIASGTLGGASNTVAPIVLEDGGQLKDGSKARLRVVHVSEDAQAAASGPVDVYLSPAAGCDTSGDAPITFSFGENAGPIEVAAATYRICITPEGSDTVVYDSGEVPLVSGADLLIAAINNTVGGDAPASLLVVDGSQTSEILDIGTGAGIRAVHNSSDVGDVDVYVNTETSDTATVSDLAFGETIPGTPSTGQYVELDAGENDVVITGAGSETAAIDLTDTELANGDRLTVLAAGSANAVGTENGLRALIFADDNRRIATEAKLRVIHGAVEAQVVDVYLVPTAADAESTVIGNTSPALNDFEYGESSGYVSVAEDDYVIFITDTDGNELFKSGSISLETQGIYTAVARLNSAPESVATVTLMDDLAPSIR